MEFKGLILIYKACPFNILVWEEDGSSHAEIKRGD